MTDTVVADIAELLDEERKRAAKEVKPETPERRARRLASSRWSRNLFWAWRHAHLLTDDELVWLSEISDASKAKGTRKSTNPWTGRISQVSRPTTGDDAIRLSKLEYGLWRRRADYDHRQHIEERRRVATALLRLGLPVPEYFASALSPQASETVR